MNRLSWRHGMCEDVLQPIRNDDDAGALDCDCGPRDVMRDLGNPDMFVPPATDAGLIPNLRFSFSMLI